jgi:hypothetical protein
MNRENFRVIDGSEEALFGWISVNLLKKTLGSSSPRLSTFEIGSSSAQFCIDIGKAQSIKKEDNTQF